MKATKLNLHLFLSKTLQWSQISKTYQDLFLQNVDNSCVLALQILVVNAGSNK